MAIISTVVTNVNWVPDPNYPGLFEAEIIFANQAPPITQNNKGVLVYWKVDEPGIYGTWIPLNYSEHPADSRYFIMRADRIQIVFKGSVWQNVQNNNDEPHVSFRIVTLN